MVDHHFSYITKIAKRKRKKNTEQNHYSVETNNWNKEKQFWDFLYIHLKTDMMMFCELCMTHDFFIGLKNMDHDGTCIILVSNHLTSTFTTSNSQILSVWFQQYYKIWCFFDQSPFVFQLQLVWIIRIKTYLNRALLVSFFVEDFVIVDEQYKI